MKVSCFEAESQVFIKISCHEAIIGSRTEEDEVSYMVRSFLSVQGDGLVCSCCLHKVLSLHTWPDAGRSKRKRMGTQSVLVAWIV